MRPSAASLLHVEAICLALLVLVFCILTVTASDVQPAEPRASAPPVQVLEVSSAALGVSENPHFVDGLQARQSDGCSRTNPCRRPLACCNGNTGQCGYTPEHCGSACISNCDARAECGAYAESPGALCRLNTCCSQHGFCGVDEDYCGEGCQSNCHEPPPTGQYDSDVRDQVVGYFGAWTLQREGCGGRTIDSIRADSLTHLNVAFGFITPDTYEITPIRGASIRDFQNLTNIKQRAPGLKVWIALGGWTHNDNNTIWQPVFGDLASTSTKRARFIDRLVRFMTEWGFDGVDLDWEYPGAPDRGGQDRDTENYVLLVRDIRARFDREGRGWGLSVAAPTSYWYLRWFDIANMVPFLDWINLMTYDIHGSWDRDSDWIGPHVYAHTNMTEIRQGLGLLWRNGVPANKVQLGLAFYGRTYTLSSTSCREPGCEFREPGTAQLCSNTTGYASFQDLVVTLQSHPDRTRVIDRTDLVRYTSWRDQWASFDDEETLQAKIAYANEVGLRGIFIWAIDQDTYFHTLLNATLQPDGLGKFGRQNGVGRAGNDWTSIDMQGGCFWSECGSTECSGPYISIENVRCVRRGGRRERRSLCCPVGNAPNPRSCSWRGADDVFGSLCNGGEEGSQCPRGTQRIASSAYHRQNGADGVCLFNGAADYCCDINSGGPSRCRWNEGWCSPLRESDGRPEIPNCPTGTRYVTHRRGRCGRDRYESFCCDQVVDASSCRWRGVDWRTDQCNRSCRGREISFGVHEGGGGNECIRRIRGIPTEGIWYPDSLVTEFPQLCCDPDGFDTRLDLLPVPLENLFRDASSIPDSDEQDFDVVVDQTMGGRRTASGDDHPDQNSFAWHIMSGPEEALTPLTKRDGSHWRLYDCDPVKHDGRQSAKMVCITQGDESTSNCHKIFKGGVAATVVEMPPHCGVGKYAVAVDMQRLSDEEANESLPVAARRRLFKRGIEQPQVWNLTFDYDYAPLQGRQDRNVRVRIDYSDIPGYWRRIVAAPPDRKRSLAVRREVLTQHGGSWKRYAEHKFHEERRSTPDHELDDLHKRWFALAIEDWLDAQLDVDTEYTAIRHSVNRNFRWTLFDQTLSCPRVDAHAALWATLNVNVETTAVATIIGRLNDISSLARESYVTFRNSGDVRLGFNFDANAELRFTTGPREVFGIAPLGASFVIPGIVTIGPQFRMIAELNGRASLNVNARVAFDVMTWDFSQQYPLREGEDGPIHEETVDEPDLRAPREGLASGGRPQFNYEARAEGMIEARVTPIVTFGIVFDARHGMPNSAIDAGVDAFARMYASSGSSSQVAWEYCYGAEAGYSVFARVSAPRLFGQSLNRRWDLLSDTFDIIPRVCDSSDSGDNDSEAAMFKM